MCDDWPGDDVKLNEFTKEEWWDVARQVKPGITREEYELMWAEFIAEKERKKLQ